MDLIRAFVALPEAPPSQTRGVTKQQQQAAAAAVGAAAVVPMVLGGPLRADEQQRQLEEELVGAALVGEGPGTPSQGATEAGVVAEPLQAGEDGGGAAGQVSMSGSMEAGGPEARGAVQEGTARAEGSSVEAGVEQGGAEAGTGAGEMAERMESAGAEQPVETVSTMAEEVVVAEAVAEAVSEGARVGTGQQLGRLAPPAVLCSHASVAPVSRRRVRATTCT